MRARAHRAYGALVLLGAVAALSPAIARTPPCPGGRYLVTAGPLLDTEGGPATDVVDVAGRMVSTGTGCGPAKGRLRGTKAGTKLLVRFKSCEGLLGKALVKGMITDACETLTATFAVKSVGIVKPFMASLSRCGDGIWDADGGEECDGDLGPCGALCNACGCGGVTTTTAVTTTTGGTATSDTTTTVPGTTTSSSTTTGGPTTTGPTTTTAPGATTSTTVTPTTTTNPTTTTATPTTTTNPTTTTAAGGTTTTVQSTSTSTMPMFTTTTTVTTTTIIAADLQVIGVSFTNTAPARSNLLMNWTVRNNGNATATAPWWDYVLFSTDGTFGGDTAIAGYQRTVSVAAAAQYPPSMNVAIPNVAAGNYYIFMQTDGANAVVESNNGNNVSGAVLLTVTNGDLDPLSLTPPGSAAAGATVQVSYSIKNQSATSSVVGPWSDQLFFSTDATLGGDTLIGSWSESVAGVNGTYNRTRNVTMPSVAAGTYHLFIVADAPAETSETNEGNNVHGPVAITIN